MFPLHNEQQGELQGMGHAARLVERFGWSSASVVGDNTVAVASIRKLPATPQVVTQNKILRRTFNLLWWPGTLLHLFWVKSELMPADAISRLLEVTPSAITMTAADALSKWNVLM